MNTTSLHIPSNRVRDIERYIHTELASLYSEGELRSFVGLLFEAFIGWDRAQLLLHRDDTINQSDLLKFHWAVEDLKHYRPIQHIIGHTEFCGLQVQVSPSVLIPRPETEELMQLVAQRMQLEEFSALDLCTGSGCIALALKKMYLKAQVTGVDVSEEALDMARRNAQANQLDVTFLPCDLLNSQLSTLNSQLWTLILSNPPYVCDSERAAMQRNVLDYEPALALFVPDDDPLRFYRVIAQYAATYLHPQGMLALEINEHLGPETVQLVSSFGLKAELHKDFLGKDRFVLATL